MQSNAVASSSRNPGLPYSAELRPRLVSDNGTNSFPIYCPLAGCRCLLLRKGTAQLVRRNGGALAHPSAKPTRHENEQFPLSPMTSSSEDNEKSDSNHNAEIDCWLVTSPMAFENVGFTKGVLSNSDPEKKAIPDLPEGASVRYLACADCDCGPLGWHVELKGRDLGRDVEAEQQSGAVAKEQNEREFLLDLTRCRYKVEA